MKSLFSSKKAIKIKIVEPCTEDFDTMDAEGKHKFCQKCQKKVYNLVGLSDKELYRFSKNHSSACVRISANKNGKTIFPHPEKNKNIFTSILSVGLMFLGIQQSMAQTVEKPKPRITNQQCPKNPATSSFKQNKNNHTPVSLSQDSTITITGQVLDENHEPLFGANIYVKSAGVGCHTDEQGYYTLTVLVPENSDTLTISCQFITFEKQEVALYLADSMPNNIQQNFVLKEVEATLVGLMIIEEKPVKRIWRKLRLWRRRR